MIQIGLKYNMIEVYDSNRLETSLIHLKRLNWQLPARTIETQEQDVKYVQS